MHCNMSPRTIITNQQINYKKHCRVGFGQYLQTHEEHTNNMEERTMGAIALRPTGNEEGSYYCLSLLTGCRITRTRFTALSMPKEVIDRIHELAKANPEGLVFYDKNWVAYTDDPVGEDSEDEASKNTSYVPSDEELEGDNDLASLDYAMDNLSLSDIKIEDKTENSSKYHGEDDSDNDSSYDGDNNNDADDDDDADNDDGMDNIDGDSND